MSDGAKKFDQGKLRVDLIPVESLEAIAAVLTFGAEKYGANNWRKGLSYSRLVGALLRHTFAFLRGESTDSESGLPHVSHAGCCILFLIWMTVYRKDMDDRYRPDATLPAIDTHTEEIALDSGASTRYY